MSEQHTEANPENLYHYEQLRRDRAFMGRRGYVLIVVGAGLLALAIFSASTAPLSRPESLLAFVLFTGFSLLLICNGLLALKRGRQPINDSEVALRRQEDRRLLFQFAQGRISRRYWLVVAIQCLIGVIFILFGMLSAWSLATHLSNLDLGETLGMTVLSLLFLLVGWYLLSGAVGRARLLRRLAQVSGKELADRLSLGEATDGE